MVAAKERKKERLLETLGTASGARSPQRSRARSSRSPSCSRPGCPREDRLAELAMLYREDCPVDFLRESRFQWEVMRDPALPVATARARADGEALGAGDPSPVPAQGPHAARSSSWPP